MPLRVSVQAFGRSEWHERPLHDLTLGRSPDCDLCLDDSSVADRHVKVLLRRGKLVAVDLGTAPRGTVMAGRRLDAPVVVLEGAALQIGEVKVAFEVLPEDEGGPVGRDFEEFGRVSDELPAGVFGIRRFQLPNQREMSWSLRSVPENAWQERLGPAWRYEAGAHFTRVPCFGRWRNKTCLVEEVPAGVRLSTLVAAESSGCLEAPLAARALIAAHLAQAMSALHGQGRVYGHLTAEAVHLTRTGVAMVLAPGPAEAPSDYHGASAARRHGCSPKIEDDRVALANLATRELRLTDSPRGLEMILGWAGRADAALDAVDVLQRFGTEVDPSTAGLASLVRILGQVFPSRKIVVSSNPSLLASRS